jgi:hypothetical protein
MPFGIQNDAKRYEAIGRSLLAIRLVGLLF